MPHLTPNEENASWNLSSDVFSLSLSFLPTPPPLIFNGNANLCILVWKIVKQDKNSRRQNPVKTTSLKGFRVIRTVAEIHPVISVNVRLLVQGKQTSIITKKAYSLIYRMMYRMSYCSWYVQRRYFFLCIYPNMYRYAYVSC